MAKGFFDKKVGERCRRKGEEEDGNGVSEGRDRFHGLEAPEDNDGPVPEIERVGDPADEDEGAGGERGAEEAVIVVGARDQKDCSEHRNEGLESREAGFSIDEETGGQDREQPEEGEEAGPAER